jgi:hypothetical protein
VAARWIAEGFGVAERTVQRALEALQACQWLARVPSTTAQEVARERQYGGRTVVNLAWEEPTASTVDEAPTVAADGVQPPADGPFPEEPVENCEPADHAMSPLPALADQRMTPTPTATIPETPGVTEVSAPSVVLDLYPFQEEKPQKVPVARAPEHPLGCDAMWHADDADAATAVVPSNMGQRQPNETERADVQATTSMPPVAATEALSATVITTMPTPAVDPAVVFAALPPALQEAQIQAATARLLAQGHRAAFLIRPVVVAEVYAQLAVASCPTNAATAVPVEDAACAATPAAVDQRPTPVVVAQPVAPLSRPTAQAHASASPQLHHVVPADLHDPARLEVLHQQAIARGWLTACPADQLRVVTAAVHARRVGNDPCALFVALLRDQRWTVLTQADEDTACALLRPSPCQAPRTTVGAPMPRLSDDACFVHGVQQLLRAQGYDADAWPAVAQRFPDWTSARWEAALAELRGMTAPQRLAPPLRKA